MIYLVESFYSFQGEGKYAGTPSIFVRFGGCNLKCLGFEVETKSPKDNTIIKGCDSIRAVDRKHFKEYWKKLHCIEDLKNIIDNYTQKLNFKPDIVFTGGEPLLYHENKIMFENIQSLQNSGFRITIETNATIHIDFKKYPMYKDTIFAMSVKLSNSNESLKKRVNLNAIESITKNSKESFFKFVLDKEFIENNNAKTEIEEIVSKFPKITTYCMPMGESAKKLEENDKVVANFCINCGYNYIDRMHIRLWNNKEGV